MSFRPWASPPTSDATASRRADTARILRTCPIMGRR